MASHQLQLYTLRVHHSPAASKIINKGKKEEDKIDPVRPIPLFDGANNLADVLAAILEGFKGRKLKAKGVGDEDDGKQVRLLTCHREIVAQGFTLHGREISGTLGLGESGYSSTIRRWDTEEEINRSAKDVDEIPIRFYFLIPENYDRAFLLVQLMGTRGIKSILQNEVNQEFNTRFENYRLEIRPTMPQSYLDQVEMEHLKGVTFIRNTRNMDDFQNAIELQENNPLIREERSFKAWGASIFKVKQAVLDYFRGNRQTLNEILNGYEDLKVKVKVGKSLRTMYLSSIQDVAWSVDISDTVVKHEGHPTMDSLKEHMRSIAADMLDELGGAGELSELLKSKKDS